jgi:pyruvate,water dikinase
MSERMVYFFGDGGAEGDPARKDVLGGKGASLAAMSRAGLPVPPGFTIATGCCLRFLESGGRWPEGLEAQVREYLGRLEQATGRKFGDRRNPLLVSVRSGAARSMPGMMDTILNCGMTPEMADAAQDPVAFEQVYEQFAVMFAKTVAGIPAAEFETLEKEVPSHHGKARASRYRELTGRILRLYEERTGKAFPATPWDTLVQCIEAVFRSWNSDRALTYRKEHDIRDCFGTAVNVQAMFPSEVSGIVFTVNPNNVAAQEMVVEGSYGLGEAIVSGDVHPDNFLVDRKTFAIKRRVIGEKTHVIAALGDSGRRAADAACLSDEQIRELAEISMRVERFFGHPVDIEWGLAGGTFALLQSRAIRGLEVVEDVEIGRKEEIHRLRELAAKGRKVWVLHNLSETLPTPTPLTWDIVGRFMTGSGGFGKMYRDFGYQPSGDVMESGFLDLICGRIYADPSRAANLFWDGMPLGYDLDAVVRDPKLMDAAPTRFEAERADGRFLASLPRLTRRMLRCNRNMKTLRKSVLDRFENEVLPPYLDWVRQKRSQDLTRLSTTQALDELDARIDRVLQDFGGESLKPGFFGGVAQAAVEGMLTQLMGREKGLALALTLSQGLEGDSTIEQSIAMFEVARGTRTLAAFLEEYGHRAVEEMELSRPRWREDSAYVRQILSVYLDPKVTSPEMTHRANVRKRQEAERALPETLRQWGGASFLEQLRTDVGDAQRMLPYRETAKHYLMMGYETIRLAIVELSRRWDLGRDVFFLNLRELREYETRRESLKPIIASRKIRWQSAKQLAMADVLDSQNLENLGLPEAVEAATELTGEPVAPGVAAGTAQLVKDPSETAGLCTDYVLVCHSTDPGWTALFVHARGLVVEKGGVLSHGAIVARDFGIPAVVCQHAMRRIPDGATIRVDGNHGIITLLDQKKE